MIGNDVVDLLDPETRDGASHPRFDRRVFAPEERAALARSGAPNRLRWILWAAKEAAYKALRKSEPGTVWSPARFVVELDEKLEGEVQHESQTLRVRVDEAADFVHAIAAQDPGELELVRAEAFRLAGSERDGEGPSRAVRHRAITCVAHWLRLPRRDLDFVRHGRIPQLEVRGEPADVDVSLSHHGRLGAYACEVGRSESG